MFKVSVPATSANLGCGFDSIGVALDIYNNFIFKKSNKKRFDIKVKNESGVLNIPLEQNLIYKALKKLFAKADYKNRGIEVIEYSNIPLARGLGSSASAILGSLIGGNYLLNNPFSQNELLKMALEMEDHPDNIVPALTGGLVINVLSKKRVEYKKINIEDDLKVILVIPDFELETKKLRKVLPKKVTLNNAVFNHSRTALLTSIFMEENWDKLSIAMEDQLHQKYRAQLIPGFKEVMAKGYKAGALGIALSGAGPTILAFGINNCEKIGEAMVEAFDINGIKSKFIISTPTNQGTNIV